MSMTSTIEIEYVSWWIRRDRKRLNPKRRNEKIIGSFIVFVILRFFSAFVFVSRQDKPIMCIVCWFSVPFFFFVYSSSVFFQPDICPCSDSLDICLCCIPLDLLCCCLPCCRPRSIFSTWNFLVFLRFYRFLCFSSERVVFVPTTTQPVYGYGSPYYVQQPMQRY